MVLNPGSSSHGAQLILRVLLVLGKRAVKPNISCREVDHNVVGVRNRLWPCCARASAFSKHVLPVLLIFDSGFKNSVLAVCLSASAPITKFR